MVCDATGNPRIERERYPRLQTQNDQACPPITLPQLVNSGPRTLPPSPLNQPTISCGESVHLTLANRGLTVALEHEVKRETRRRWSNDYPNQCLVRLRRENKDVRYEEARWASGSCRFRLALCVKTGGILPPLGQS